MRRPFEEELTDWLLAADFTCSHLPPIVGLFTALQISKSGRQIRLILVDLQKGTQATNAQWEELRVCVTETRRQGYTCVVLWEDFWVSRKKIVCSRLSALLGHAHKIPARLTQVRRIDKQTTDPFMEKNHLNGSVTSKYKYGLFLPARYFRVLTQELLPTVQTDELLVAVATFSFARIFNKDTSPHRSHELIRFASLLNTNVVGGLDKLLQAFIKDKHPHDIMTYADVEWSDGGSYRKLGFDEKQQTAPETFFVDPENMRRQSKTETVNSANSTNETAVKNMGSIKFVKTVTPVD